jgi:DNA-directed RNA polymerase III subunit RPC7
MSYRGGRGGRGRGGGRGGFIAKQVPFELFPELQDFPDAKSVKEEPKLEFWSIKLETFWKFSPYHYEGVVKGGSGKNSEKTSNPKAPLSDFIKMTHEYVPAELAGKKERRPQKKVRWNPELEERKLDDLLDRLEKKGEKAEKEGKEEEEEEEDVEPDDLEDDYSDEDDYTKAQECASDEDDVNDPDNGIDEATYD